MKISRKIYNFKSEILVNETIIKYGYNPNDLGISSSKFVVAICRFCGLHIDIRKGFFNKSGSACHKSCKIEEQKINSPFKNAEIREKAKNRIEELYGKGRESIGKKISESNRKEETISKRKKTNLERFGVENVFQSDEIKSKIKKTNIEKYGFESPMQNEYIKAKTKQTCFEKYGVDVVSKSSEIKEKIKKTFLKKYGLSNPQKNDKIKKNTVASFKESISSNELYKQINALNSNCFWEDMKSLSLIDICKKYDLKYQSLTSALSKAHFREKYKDVYSFPKNQMQKELYDSIKSFYSGDILFNCRSVISPLELDLYIPEHKIGIEFNGSFWHSEAVLGYPKCKIIHKIKTDKCIEQGIKLFHIFEYNWVERKSQWINFIKNALKMNQEKIMARKCIVTNDECKYLIDENHIQGVGSYPIKYFTLKYKDRIVGVMTANRHHRKSNEKSSIVLGRLVFEKNVNVIGGASKLFSEFKKWAKMNGYSQIISWSDYTYSYGNIYSKLDFVLDKDYPPDYFYWDSKNGCYKSKQSQSKRFNGCPKEIKEHDYCISIGLYRIYDCGKKRWIFKL